jgi:hypothetical protein
MKAILRLAVVLLVPLLVTAASQAAPQNFGIDTNLPSMIIDTTRPRECTITYLLEDISNNDLFASRMQFSPAFDAVAMKGRLPCPKSAPPRVGERALDSCRERAANQRTCVFADMSRGFETAPAATNTSQGASYCESDLASQIGVACWNAGKFDVCNVACGNTPEEAMQAARNRCEGKHQKSCTITGALPVLAP